MSIADVRVQIASAQIFEVPKPGDEFGEIIQFDNNNLPDIPALLLPPPYSEYAAGLATELELCQSVPVLATLAILSTALAGKFVVSPKPGWNEPVNIYALISLPPANNKSQVLKRLTAPLIAYEKEQAAILMPEVRKKRSEFANKEALIKRNRAKAANEKSKESRLALFEEVTTLEAELIEPPVLPKLFINDVTAESLATIVYEQGQCLGILSDEGGLIEVISGLYSGGAANIDIILKGFDGGDVRIVRRDRQYDMNPFLTLMLIVQPQVLQNIKEKRSLKGNGFQERFLYLIPQSNLGNRTHDTESVSSAIEDGYKKAVDTLLRIIKRELQIKLTLSDEAGQAFLCFRHEIEKELLPHGMFYACKGWGGKVCGFALRIAGLLHVAKHNGLNHVIDTATMANAIDVARLLSKHAIRAYEVMEVDRVTADAEIVAAWIKYESLKEFTLTDLTNWSKNRALHKEARRAPALAELTRRNIISEPRAKQENKNARKPTTYYAVNLKYLDESG